MDLKELWPEVKKKRDCSKKAALKIVFVERYGRDNILKIHFPTTLPFAQ